MYPSPDGDVQGVGPHLQSIEGTLLGEYSVGNGVEWLWDYVGNVTPACEVGCVGHGNTGGILRWIACDRSEPTERSQSPEGPAARELGYDDHFEIFLGVLQQRKRAVG